MEALISSLLFKVKYISRTNKRPSPTLYEMQLNPRKHVLSFISSMQQGIRYFGIPRYFFRLNFTSGIKFIPFCCVQWVHFIVEKQTNNCSIGTVRGEEWEEWNPYPNRSSFISFGDIEPSRWALSFTIRILVL